MTEGQYLVMWQVYKNRQRKGFLNMLLGKKVKRTEQIIHSYDSEELAEYGFKNLKSNGCTKPLLLKIIKE